MKARAIGYWICTILIAFTFLSGGIFGVLRMKGAVEGITHLGYPMHFVVFLSAWKILGAVVVLLPGLALVKEWAYAGMIFDLTGATVAHGAAGDDLRDIITPLFIAVLVVASWALRPDSRKLKRS